MKSKTEASLTATQYFSPRASVRKFFDLRADQVFRAEADTVFFAGNFVIIDHYDHRFLALVESDGFLTTHGKLSPEQCEVVYLAIPCGQEAQPAEHAATSSPEARSQSARKDLPPVSTLEPGSAQFFELPVGLAYRIEETEIAFPDDWVLVSYAEHTFFGRLTADGCSLPGMNLLPGSYEILGRAILLWPAVAQKGPSPQPQHRRRRQPQRERERSLAS